MLCCTRYTSGAYSNPLNFPFQIHAGGFLHTRAHGFAQALNVGGRSAVEADQEIAVQFGYLRTADAQAAAASLVHQFPGAQAGRIFEGRTASAVAWLARFALRLDRGHLSGDRGRITSATLQGRTGEDDVIGNVAVAIGKSHLSIAERAHISLPVKAARLDQHLLGFAAIGAAVHAPRAADGAGNAAEEGEARNSGLLRLARYLGVEHRAAGDDAVIGLNLDLVESAAESDHHARHAAVTHA